MTMSKFKWTERKNLQHVAALTQTHFARYSIHSCGKTKTIGLWKGRKAFNPPTEPFWHRHLTFGNTKLEQPDSARHHTNRADHQLVEQRDHHHPLIRHYPTAVNEWDRYSSHSRRGKKNPPRHPTMESRYSTAFNPSALGPGSRLLCSS